MNNRTVSPLDSIAQSTRNSVFVLLLFCFPMMLFMLGGWGFFDPDEGRYAEIPREMLLRGDWVVPTLNYVPYIEKPPLLYWGTMLSFLAFGYNEVAGRLIPALASVLGVLFTYGVGRRMFGQRAGFLGALALATTIFWSVMARSLIIDPLVALTIWGALCCWWMAQSEGELQSDVDSLSTQKKVETRRTLWLLAFWAMMALGVLSKGPIGAVLPLAVTFLYALMCRRWNEFFRLKWIFGVPLFLLMTVPWFYLVAQRVPGYNEFFWYGQNLMRFLGKGKNREHVKPMTYFLMWLPLVMFPWSAFLPAGVVEAWNRFQNKRASRNAEYSARAEYSYRARGAIFLLISFAFITLFFSISTSKLITYILPAMPPLALLIGFYVDEWLRGKTRANNAPALLIGLGLLTLLLIGLAVAGPLVGVRELVNATGSSSPWVYVAVLVLLAWSATTLWLMLKKRGAALVGTMAVGATVLFTIALQIIAQVAPHQNSRDLMRLVEPGLARGGQIVFAGSPYTPSMSFYTGQRAVIVDKVGELRFGRDSLSTQERAQWFPENDSVLPSLIAQRKPMYFIAKDKEAAEKLQRKFPQLTILVANRRRAVLGNSVAAQLTPPREFEPYK